MHRSQAGKTLLEEFADAAEVVNTLRQGYDREASLKLQNYSTRFGLVFGNAEMIKALVEEDDEESPAQVNGKLAG